MLSRKSGEMMLLLDMARQRARLLGKKLRSFELYPHASILTTGSLLAETTDVYWIIRGRIEGAATIKNFNIQDSSADVTMAITGGIEFHYWQHVRSVVMGAGFKGALTAIYVEMVD